MNRRRVVLAFLIAPLAVPPVILAVFMAMHVLQLGWFSGGDARYALVTTMIWSFYAVPIAVGVTLVGGVPCYLLFSRRGWFTARHYALAGLALGLAPIVLFDLVIYGLGLWQSAQIMGFMPAVKGLVADIPIMSAFLAMGVVSGICSALAFWAVAFRRSAHERSAT